MTTYAEDTLLADVAYVAYHLSWSLDDILDLEHPLRVRLIGEIGELNRQLSESDEED